MRSSSNSLYNCHNPKGIKLMTRLCLALSHSQKHTFKHSFQNSINSSCNCGYEFESTVHFFHCPLFTYEKRILSALYVI